MLAYVILLGLLIGACYWILNPLLRGNVRQDGFTPKPEDILEELRSKKNGAYAAVKELEFDLSMGKLTEEDFQILKWQYTQEAVEYMKEIDKLESSLAAFSKPLTAVSEKENEEGITVVRKPKSTLTKHIYCTSCGAKAAIEGRFCSVCGTKLPQRRKNNLQEEN